MRKNLNKSIYKELMAVFGMSYSPQAMTDHFQKGEQTGDGNEEEKKIAEEVMEKHKKEREQATIFFQENIKPKIEEKL